MILVLLAVAPASAQEHPTGISGRVTTMDGTLFARARIRVVNRATKKSVSALTDWNGEYFVQVQPATYDVFVEADSWRPERRKGLKVTEGNRLVVDFVLYPARM